MHASYLNRLPLLMLRAAVALLLYSCCLLSWAADYDLLFRGGHILDGSGTPAIRADIGINDDIIVAIADLSEATADRIVDISGHTLVPGFIDIHSHADGAGEGGLRSRDPRRRAAPNMVAQGVTTLVVNQDGRSPRNIALQRRQLEERRFGPNVALMVGHNTVRRGILGRDFRRPATRDEIAAMTAKVIEGMDAGAYGLSAGLEYIPGIWSETEELVALVKALFPYGGVYIVHERSSGQDPMWYVPSKDLANPPTMLDNIHEQIRIARETGVTTVATHIKARGTNYWGKSEQMVDAIQTARDQGVPIFADQYPYTSSGSDGTITILPSWVAAYHDETAKEKDFGKALERVLLDDDASADLRRDAAHQIVRRGGPENIVVFEYPDPEYIGKSLAELARRAEITPLEMAFKLQFEGYRDRFGGARLRGFSMAEDDIQAFAAQSWTITASDAGIALPSDPPVHARFYGTFPRKIARYAKERNVMSIEQAVRSMTSLPARVMGFENRGLIREGYAADIAVIDLDTIRDRATFFEPHRYPEGIPYVMVNGEMLVDNGKLTWALPGRILTPGGRTRDTD